MRRRSRAGGEPVKTRRRKTAARKRGNAQKAVRPSSSSASGPEAEVVRLTRELVEAREQQTATGDVLKVISRSAFDLQAVLNTLVESAARLCEADTGLIRRREGDTYPVAATFGVTAQQREHFASYPTRPDRGSAFGRAILKGRIVHIPDVLADPEFDRPQLQSVGRFRAVLAVPLMREGVPIGALGLMRSEPRPFTDEQIALVQNFADQAVIAIENTRLLNELRQRTDELSQRTDDLSEALEQQTATSEVLKVISSSPGELKPVFQAMLENAVRICEAKFGFMNRYEGDTWKIIAVHGAAPAYTEFLQQHGYRRPGPETVSSRIATTKQLVHIADLAASRGYAERDPVVVAAVELGGVRTMLGVPMLKEGELIGAILLYRQEVRPFTDKQIALVQNFAAQAVIAIENTRLLNELRQSLQQQTATADVLKIISRSTFDLQTVLNTLVESASRHCDAYDSIIFLHQGGRLHVKAHYGPLQLDFADWPIGRGWITGRAFVDRTSVQVHDPAASAEEFPDGSEMALRLGYRTILAVPLLREHEAIGVLTIRRSEVKPFTDEQVALVETFADQAVIAIENVRLFEAEQQRTRELTESLEQQTATADVLRIISSSPGELEPVFQAMLENATKLCGAEFGVFFLDDGDLTRIAAAYKVPPALAATQNVPFRVHSKSGHAEVRRTKQVVHIDDIRAMPPYLEGDPRLVAMADLGGARTTVAVPMLKGDALLGVFAIYRKEVRPFTAKQIELVSNFANQAVIAIENTRLLNELRESLQQQTATADVLKIISRSAYDLQTVLQTLVESAARFCAADKAQIIREKEGVFYTAETYGYSREFMDYIENIPIKAERGTASGRALVEGRVVHIADVRADPEYTLVEASRLGDFRTALSVPMLREGIPVGVLTLTRSEVQPFTDKQIELVTTFADQAAIAIENVRLFDEIQDKSRQLEEASQHKSQFLANMSHELRTPLNAILGYTELMADGAYGEPSEKMLGILKRLEANGRHLLGLINDVLDLSKIEAGQLVLELSDYCIQDIAQTVRSTLEPLAADKRLGFKVEVAPQLPSGHGDGRRLTQVLINLAGNAIKFTDAGEVAIKAEANNGSFHVSVRDTGPGISSADQARLFQEFQQADNAITKKKGGTGLGLAISKRIIEMHGGRIWVESQPGRGSTFAFTLPVIVERQVEAA
jgi:GAF domain-containing protein